MHKKYIFNAVTCIYVTSYLSSANTSDWRRAWCSTMTHHHQMCLHSIITFITSICVGVMSVSVLHSFLCLVDSQTINLLCRFEEQEAPGSRSFFTEIIASISDIKFAKDGRYILSRDYMTLKVW